MGYQAGDTFPVKPSMPPKKNMTRLEDLQPTAAVRGILPDQVVTVVSVQWFGSEALELTYKGPSGRVANELLYRHDEPRLEVVEHGRPWSFDGDGHLFRLVSACCGVRGAGYRDSDIGPLQGGGIVHAVVSHADDVSELLEGLDDGIFVLGKDLSKTLSLLDLSAASSGIWPLVTSPGKEIGGRLYVRTHAQLPGDLRSNRSTVAGDHFDATP